MLEGLYTAAAGMAAQERRLDAVSNDIANVNTAGYKKVRLGFRDHVVELGPGRCCVVPSGVEHHPVADEECWIVLIETVTTLHTGDRITAQTRSIDEQLAG